MPGNMERADGRKYDECREITIEGPHYLKNPRASTLISMGDTKVLCCVSVRETVPHFIQGKGIGWLTSQYSMLPQATHTRNERESRLRRLHGRTMEISRLIGRSIRACVDMSLIGERTIIIDCDVLQADGGTRTASISGGFVALVGALNQLLKEDIIFENPIKSYIGAISVGLLDDAPLLDLNYREDSSVQVDLNCVMTESGDIIEIQATGEGKTFSRDQLDEMTDLAWVGVQKIIAEQKKVLE